MLQLTGWIDGEEHSFPLEGDRLTLGRGSDNDIRLVDPSVSRQHVAVEQVGGGWRVRDLGSTNGTELNGARVDQAPLVAGDLLKVGAFVLRVDDDSEVSQSTEVPTPVRSTSVSQRIAQVPNATIVRPLDDFSAAYGLGEAGAKALPSELPEVAYGNRIFGFLTRLAGLLISADSVSEVLERVMAIAFEALPVERGFILFSEPGEEGVCELARFGDEVVHRPERGVPVSQTILKAVTQDRVALLTYDARADGRLKAGESIRLHGIRAAISAPLWSGDRIMGLMQVDSSVQVGAFGERDLDFLTALANYAAVAVERLRNAEQAELERRRRGSLERYHSPAVIEAVMRDADNPDGGLRSLRTAQASVMFVDAVGFTAFSEKARPSDVATLLNGYFDQTVEAIFARGGTLDKFIGDAVMAFFGAPLEQEDHAERAVRAALDARRSLDWWNSQREEAGAPRIEVRIAINSGPVVVGDVGSRRRVDYTVLGNTVNVAARLEEYAAAPGEIIIGEETQRLLQLAGCDIETESIGPLRLKGLEAEVNAYRVLDAEGDMLTHMPTQQIR